MKNLLNISATASLLFFSTALCAGSVTQPANGDVLIEGSDQYCIGGATIRVEGGRSGEAADVEIRPGGGCSSSYTGRIYLYGITGIDNKLYVRNKIYAEGVQITQTVGWPDYVFEQDYPLRPLHEVESYIEQHKRLPDVAPAADFEKNGYDMADVDNMLMKKVEELTLYIIEQDKRIQELESRLND